ncbi:MAG: TadE/TadG family type IV pilus assembly protein [Acutalibacteraceae bacterium]|nr:TadE/TadG family type IV pilus assembly protein [Acutalibacteraceae bacterium]
MKKHLRKKGKGEDGQAMVEFALILPIFLLILCGIIDFGWLFYNQLSLNNACREGARYAVVNTAEGNGTQAIINHIENATTTVFANDGVRIDVEYTTPSDPTAGDVTVSMEADISFFTPVLSTVLGSERTITSTVVMKVES